MAPPLRFALAATVGLLSGAPLGGARRSAVEELLDAGADEAQGFQPLKAWTAAAAAANMFGYRHEVAPPTAGVAAPPSYPSLVGDMRTPTQLDMAKGAGGKSDGGKKKNKPKKQAPPARKFAQPKAAAQKPPAQKVEKEVKAVAAAEQNFDNEDTEDFDLDGFDGDDDVADQEAVADADDQDEDEAEEAEEAEEEDDVDPFYFVDGYSGAPEATKAPKQSQAPKAPKQTGRSLSVDSRNPWEQGKPLAWQVLPASESVTPVKRRPLESDASTARDRPKATEAKDASKVGRWAGTVGRFEWKRKEAQPQAGTSEKQRTLQVDRPFGYAREAVSGRQAITSKYFPAKAEASRKAATEAAAAASSKASLAKAKDASKVGRWAGTVGRFEWKRNEAGSMPPNSQDVFGSRGVWRYSQVTPGGYKLMAERTSSQTLAATQKKAAPKKAPAPAAPASAPAAKQSKEEVSTDPTAGRSAVSRREGGAILPDTRDVYGSRGEWRRTTGQWERSGAQWQSKAVPGGFKVTEKRAPMSPAPDKASPAPAPAQATPKGAKATPKVVE